MVEFFHVTVLVDGHDFDEKQTDGLCDNDFVLVHASPMEITRFFEAESFGDAASMAVSTTVRFLDESQRVVGVSVVTEEHWSERRHQP